MTERQASILLEQAREYVLPGDDPAPLDLSPSEAKIAATAGAVALAELVERHLARNMLTMQLMAGSTVGILIVALGALLVVPGYVHQPLWALFGLPLAWMLLALAYALRVALPRIQTLERARGLLLMLVDEDPDESTVVLVDQDPDLPAD